MAGEQNPGKAAAEQAMALLLRLVHVDEVDPDLLTTGERADHRTQRGRGPTGAADDLADVLGGDLQLIEPAAIRVGDAEAHLVRLVDQGLREVREKRLHVWSRRVRAQAVVAGLAFFAVLMRSDTVSEGVAPVFSQ